MLDNEQQFPLQMDLPHWYSDRPGAVPPMLDENDVDEGVQCDLRGCLAAFGLIVAVWAAFAGLAFGGPPAGYGMLQGGSRNNALTAAQFAHPKIDFIVLRDRWNKQQTGPSAFDFRYNAAQIRRCRQAGKGYIVAPMTGSGSTPAFVAGPRYKNRRGELTLAPWSPSIPAAYDAFIYAQANTEVDGVKVKDDPLCCAVWCTGPTVPSQELHLNGLENAPGYNPAGIVSNWRRCIKATHAAFPNKPGILSLSGQAAVQKYQPQIINAMKAEYGRDAIFQHNSLGTQTTVTATHHRLVLEQERQGYRVGAEMVQPGQTAGLAKFPQRDYAVIYPGDERGLR